MLVVRVVVIILVLIRHGRSGGDSGHSVHGDSRWHVCGMKHQSDSRASILSAWEGRQRVTKSRNSHIESSVQAEADKY